MRLPGAHIEMLRLTWGSSFRVLPLRPWEGTVTAQVFAFLPPMGENWVVFMAADFSRPHLGHKHLEREPTNESSLSLSFPLPPCQVNKLVNT